MSVERFNCPDCGVGVRADEDGCCAHCGADCEIVAVEATPPKHEHEWEHKGELFMVSWARLFSGLSNEAVYEGWLVSIKSPAGSWLRQDGDYMALAAEIARLAGLTEPEDRK